MEKFNDEKFVVDFGIRKLYNHKFSTVISLPRYAIKNCGDSEFQKVSVKLVNENGEKYLKLSPVFDLKRIV